MPSTRTGSTSTSTATGSRSPTRCTSYGWSWTRPRASAVDITWEGSVRRRPGAAARPAQRQPSHARTRSGSRSSGSWSGHIVIDGEEIAVDPSTWIGTRDRSWGIRPIGEPEPAGRPADPPFEGMWWLYVPMAFDDFCDRHDHPGGAQRIPLAQRLHPDLADGRVEQLGWPRVKIHYRSGHPDPNRRDDRRHRARWHPGALRRGIQTAGADPRRRRLRRRLATGCTACGRARSSPSA